MRLLNFNPAVRWLAGLVLFLAFSPNLFAHYSLVIDTSLSYDAPTLQIISQRAAANQPLIQAGIARSKGQSAEQGHDRLVRQIVRQK